MKLKSLNIRIFVVFMITFVFYAIFDCFIFAEDRTNSPQPVIFADSLHILLESYPSKKVYENDYIYVKIILENMSPNSIPAPTKYLFKNITPISSSISLKNFQGKMIAYTGLLTNESYQTQVYEDLSPGEKRVYYYNYIRIPEWARLTHDETNDKDHITLKLQASISEKDNNGHYITSSPIEITIKRRSPTESELLKNTNLLFIPWYLSRPTYLVARVLHKPEDATKEPLDTIFDKVKIKYEKATGKKYDKPIPVVSQHSGNRVEWVYYHTKQPVMGELDILISNLSDSTLKNMYRLERIKLHFGARYASNQILSVRFGVECALDESEQEEQLTKLSEFFNSLNKLEAEYLALELKENMFFSPYVNEVMRKKFMNVVAEYLPRDFQ